MRSGGHGGRNKSTVKVNDGAALFAWPVDGRTTRAKRYKEILDGIFKDVGTEPTGAQSIFARRAATLALWCEKIEADMVNGGDFDQTTYMTATNSLRRLLDDLGLAHDSDPPELVRATRVRNAVQKEIRRVNHEPS